MPQKETDSQTMQICSFQQERYAEPSTKKQTGARKSKQIPIQPPTPPHIRESCVGLPPEPREPATGIGSPRSEREPVTFPEARSPRC